MYRAEKPCYLQTDSENHKNKNLFILRSLFMFEFDHIFLALFHMLSSGYSM